MNKLTRLFISFLVAALCGGAMSPRTVVIAGGRQSGGGGSSFNIGRDTLPASSDTFPASYGIAMRVQASASGTLQNGFFYFNGTNLSKVKLCVYGPTDASSAQTTTDLLIGASGSINATGSAGLVGPVAMSGGTVTAGQYYFLVIFISGDAFLEERTENSAFLTYWPASGAYASPPANLAAGGLASGNYGRIYAYITAQ
jgi:hypothetical protein